MLFRSLMNYYSTFQFSNLQVTTSGSANPPAITSTNAFSGTVGVAFSNTITATGDAPITFSGTGLPGGLSVASDGAIFGVQRGRGFCVFDGRAWKPVAEAAADVRGIVWSATGGDGAVVVKFDRGFGLRVGDAWTFKSDLRPLVEQQVDLVAEQAHAGLALVRHQRAHRQERQPETRPQHAPWIKQQHRHQ